MTSENTATVVLLLGALCSLLTVLLVVAVSRYKEAVRSLDSFISRCEWVVEKAGDYREMAVGLKHNHSYTCDNMEWAMFLAIQTAIGKKDKEQFRVYLKDTFVLKKKEEDKREGKEK